MLPTALHSLAHHPDYPTEEVESSVNLVDTVYSMQYLLYSTIDEVTLRVVLY